MVRKINAALGRRRSYMRAFVFANAILKCIASANHKSQTKKDDDRDLFSRVRDAFHVFARTSSNVLGSPWAFIIAILIIVVWAALGPTFRYSDTWQLIINTGTTIVTFLMVFLIQNTQNRDAKAVHLKLDELIRALTGARNNLVDLEELSDEELKKLEAEFKRLSEKASRTQKKTHGGIREEIITLLRWPNVLHRCE